MKKPHYYIDYYSAVHWLHSSLILFNEINAFDPYFLESISDFDYENDEIFQFFLTSYSDDDVKWLQKTFPDLIFGYSEKMNLWILCVDHFGTSWDYVWTKCCLPEDVLPETWNDKNEATRHFTRETTARFMKCSK